MDLSRDEFIGRAIRSLRADRDEDENGEARQIPIGTIGVISRLNHVDAKGERHYDVEWSNGGWTVYSRQEVLSELKLIG